MVLEGSRKVPQDYRTWTSKNQKILEYFKPDRGGIWRGFLAVTTLFSHMITTEALTVIIRYGLQCFDTVQISPAGSHTSLQLLQLTYALSSSSNIAPTEDAGPLAVGFPECD